MPGYRHRYMYYLTGLPGWMRFGFSPGWLGRSPTGFGPCAQYLLTGQWPFPISNATWPATATAFPTFYGWSVPWGGASPFSATSAGVGVGGDELTWLRNQQNLLEQQIEAIKERIKQLSGE